MTKSFYGRTKLCNYLCAVLTLCLLILQFTPFWRFGENSISINGYVWLDCSNSEIANWFSSQLGSAPNINSIVITAVLVLLLGIAGVVLCIMKSNVGFAALLPAAASLSALYAFAFKPVFRLGSTWLIQLLICILILAAAAMSVIFGLQKNKQEAFGEKALSQNDIDARVNAIRALGQSENSKKSGSAENDSNFYKLLTYLSDDIPECRIAAAETLGQTSRDVALTHIIHLLASEKDDRVIAAMKTALSDIRENIRREHSEKA